MNFLKKYWHVLVLTIICLIAVYITATDGGIHIRDLWYDEAYSLFIIKAGWAKLWRYIYQDVHQPTYYRIIKLWSYITGHSDVAIRAFSLLPYIGIIIYAYKLVYKMTANKYMALLATAAIAANPFIREYAQEARMYELLAFIWMLIFYKSVGFIQGDRSKGQSWAMGLALAGGFFMHYFSLAYGAGFLVLLFGILILQQYQEKNHKSLLHIKISLIKKYWMIYVPMIIGFLICLPMIMHQYGSGTVASVLQPMTLDFTMRSIGVFFLGHEQSALGIQPVNLLFSSQGSHIAGIFLAIAGVLSTLYALVKWRRYSLLLITLGGWGALLAAIIISVIKGNNLYVERYLVFIAPALIVSILLSAYHLKKYLGYIIAAIFIVLPWFIVQPTYTKTGLREYAKTIVEQKIPAVAIKSDLDYLSARYYLEHYNYTGKILMRTQDPRTPDRSIYRGHTSAIFDLSELTQPTAIISYQEEKEAILLPYKFGFATMYLYTPKR